MNKQQLYHLMDHPERLDENTLGGLLELLEEYPYFQVGRMLLVKNMHLLDHVKYSAELKRAAVHVSDRTRLFELIHKGEPLAETDDKELAVAEKKSPQSDVNSSSMVALGKVESVDRLFQDNDVTETVQGKTIDVSYHTSSQLGSDYEKDMPLLDGHELFDFEKAGFKGYSIGNKQAQEVGGNRSFSDWLSAVDMPLDKGPMTKEASEPTSHKMAIINRFLSDGSAKKIPVPAIKKAAEDRSRESMVESDELMTETLAGIYVRQKHYDKAIVIFEKLGLKYPEKSVYFAQQIKKLQELSNNK